MIPVYVFFKNKINFFSLQLFFKNRVQDEEGYILFVRKNAIQVLVPRYGLEGTVFLNTESSKNLFVYNEEVSTYYTYSHKVRWFVGCTIFYTVLYTNGEIVILK